MPTSEKHPNDFYPDRPNNDTDSVKSRIEAVTSDQIDKMEEKGKTILQPAVSNRSDEIVELPSNNDTSESRENSDIHTPSTERGTNKTKELCSPVSADDKFVGDFNDTIEWIRVGEHIDREAKVVRKMLNDYSTQNSKKDKKSLIEMIDLGHYERIEKIKWHFDQANEKNDPTCIITAYTEQTEFYQRLNRALAKVHELDPKDDSQRQLLDFLNLICCHPDFRKYEFRGETYRGLKMDADDLKQYQVGAKIMTKSLVSTSKVRRVAEKFAAKTSSNDDTNPERKTCICKYQTRKAHTALDIHELSAYSREQEVLIIPYSAFEVVNVEEKENEFGTITEIEFRQCKSYIQTHALLTGIGTAGFCTVAIGALVAAAVVLCTLCNDDED